MASAVQRLLPWRRKTLTVSGKEPHFHNCTYLGPVTVLDAHNTHAALRSCWKRYKESNGFAGSQVTLRLKVNRLEMTYDNRGDTKSDEEFFLHRIVTCQCSANEEPTPAPTMPILDGSSDEDNADIHSLTDSHEEDYPVVDTLVAWSYRHEHRRSRVTFKAHVVNFTSVKRAINFHTTLTEKLVFSLEEYRRERLQRQSCRARMVRTRSVDSALQRKHGAQANAPQRNAEQPLRKTTLSTARHFKPESKAASKLQILDEATEEEEEDAEEEKQIVHETNNRLSRLSIALVD